MEVPSSAACHKHQRHLLHQALESAILPKPWSSERKPCLWSRNTYGHVQLHPRMICKRGNVAARNTLQAQWKMDPICCVYPPSNQPPATLSHPQHHPSERSGVDTHRSLLFEHATRMAPFGRVSIFIEMLDITNLRKRYSVVYPSLTTSGAVPSLREFFQPHHPASKSVDHQSHCRFDLHRSR